ncbi:hypothetical protein [Pseudocolwellia agarivorans]|uniref:hypothetical protein n=1 Tax=Pseudocolwellia agarivorans TaxID=1911682 RepID=UPI0009852870|nr:hypothetical protein [Pseudocolwellia agarivorans]
MKKVKFFEVNLQDSSDYIFVDEANRKYHLFNDARAHGIKNVTPDFWDKFFFCETIIIEFTDKNGKNIINKVVSYK